MFSVYLSLFSLLAIAGSDGNVPLFFNYDCVEVSTGSVAWDGVHRTLQVAAAAESLVLDVQLLDAVFSTDLDRYYTTCPIGTLSLGLLQAFRHQAAGNSGEAERILTWVRRNFATWPWYVVAQSRWPFFELMLNYFDDEAGEDISGYTCCAVESGVMEWPDVLAAGRAFIADNGGKMETAELIGNLSNTLFSKANTIIDVAMDECMCGVVFLAVVQSLSAAARLSQYFPNWAKIVQDFLLHVPVRVYLSRWPVVETLVMFADLNKGDKFIAYSASGDKLRRRYSDLLPAVAGALRASTPEESAFLSSAVTLVNQAAMTLPSPQQGRRVVAYTMVYGSTWTGLISQAVAQFGRIGMEKVLFVTLGKEAKEACALIAANSQGNPGVYCLEFPSPHNSQIHRYTAAHVIVQAGVDAFYFDLDTFFFKSPLPALAATLAGPGKPINARSARVDGPHNPDFLISSHADGNCVNVGFFYVKAAPSSAEFMTLFIDWYHRHAYEIDQRGMDAFLGHSKTIGASFIPGRIRGGEDELVMHYAVLDDVNQFVIPGVGWHGDFADVVVAHYCEWDFERKMEDLNFLFNRSQIAQGDVETFFDKYKLDNLRERLECW